MSDSKELEFPVLAAFVDENKKIVTNAQKTLKDSQKLLDNVLKTSLVTDEDFQRQKLINKKLTAAKDSVKVTMEAVKKEFSELYEYEKTADAIYKNYASAFTHGTKAVVTEQRKRVEAETTRIKDATLNSLLPCFKLMPSIKSEVTAKLDIETAQAVKGLKTIASVTEKAQAAAENVMLYVEDRKQSFIARKDQLTDAGLNSTTKHLVPDLESLLLDESTDSLEVFLGRLDQAKKASTKNPPKMVLTVSTKDVDSVPDSKPATPEPKVLAPKTDVAKNLRDDVNKLRTLAFTGIKTAEQHRQALSVVSSIQQCLSMLEPL